MTKLFGNNDWETLFSNWATIDASGFEWDIVVKGVIESFQKSLQISFKSVGLPWTQFHNSIPSTGFELVACQSTPLGEMNYYAKGGVGAYQTKESEILTVEASVFMFIYLDRIRLLGERSGHGLSSDYLRYSLERTSEGVLQWKNCGWDQGGLSEWEGLELPVPSS